MRLEDKALRRTYELVMTGTLYPMELADLAWFIRYWQVTSRLMYQTTLLMDAYRVDVLEMVR